MYPNKVRMEQRRGPTGDATIFAFDGGNGWQGSFDPVTSSYNNVKDIPQDTPLYNMLFKGTDFDDNLDGRFVDYAERGPRPNTWGRKRWTV